MKLAVCSVQRNRGPWLLEWVAFHHLVGVTDFVLYLHQCDDDSAEVVSALSRIFRIRAFEVGQVDFAPQLNCFAHALREYAQEFDWMAFIDGDEFLFPTAERSLGSVLTRYDALSVSAVGAYWRCFGSSGHRQEPHGLVTENYRLASEPGFAPNGHIKSIVRRDAAAQVLSNSHYFATALGTVDEKLAPIQAGYDATHRPSWSHLQINHYATQSREFYEQIKRGAGAADGSPQLIRQEQWWQDYDRNEVPDDTLLRFGRPLRELVDGLCAQLGWDPARLGGMPARRAGA